MKKTMKKTPPRQEKQRQTIALRQVADDLLWPRAHRRRLGTGRYFHGWVFEIITSRATSVALELHHPGREEGHGQNVIPHRHPPQGRHARDRVLAGAGRNDRKSPHVEHREYKHAQNSACRLHSDVPNLDAARRYAPPLASAPICTAPVGAESPQPGHTAQRRAVQRGRVRRRAVDGQAHEVVEPVSLSLPRRGLPPQQCPHRRNQKDPDQPPKCQRLCCVLLRARPPARARRQQARHAVQAPGDPQFELGLQ